jgi:hypothetical protein
MESPGSDRDVMPVNFNISQDVYDELDMKAREVHGIDFQELVEHNPEVAYGFLLDTMQSLTELFEVNEVNFNEMKLSKKMDGEEATAGAASRAMEQVVAATDFQAFDVVISVFSKSWFRRYIDILRDRKSFDRVVSFRVEPPDLAS